MIEKLKIYFKHLLDCISSLLVFIFIIIRFTSFVPCTFDIYPNILGFIFRGIYLIIKKIIYGILLTLFIKKIIYGILLTLFIKKILIKLLISLVIVAKAQAPLKLLPRAPGSLIYEEDQKIIKSFLKEELSALIVDYSNRITVNIIDHVKLSRVFSIVDYNPSLLPLYPLEVQKCHSIYLRFMDRKYRIVDIFSEYILTHDLEKFLYKLAEMREQAEENGETILFNIILSRTFAVTKLLLYNLSRNPVSKELTNSLRSVIPELRFEVNEITDQHVDSFMITHDAKFIPSHDHEALFPLPASNNLKISPEPRVKLGKYLIDDRELTVDNSLALSVFC